MRLKWLFRTLLLGLLLNLVPGTGHSQDLQDYKQAQFIEGKDTLGYRILYPQEFKAHKKYPLVLFLHGAGERGKDNIAQLTHGGDLFLKDSVRTAFPAIVVFPQAPKEDYWAQVAVDRDTIPLEFDFQFEKGPTRSLELVMGLVDSLKQKEFIDPDRIYLGGLSMGAMGTYELLGRRPDVFAAAFAICGGGAPVIAKKLPPGFPIWIFHGEKDDVVLPRYSKEMARLINSAGGNAKLSLYPDDNHNSWDSALAEPCLLPWLFSITKNDKHEKKTH